MEAPVGQPQEAVQPKRSKEGWGLHVVEAVTQEPPGGKRQVAQAAAEEVVQASAQEVAPAAEGVALAPAQEVADASA